MQKKLLQPFPQQEHNEKKANFYEARSFRKDLEVVLTKELDNLYGSLRVNNYDKPGWSAEHADYLGQIKATKRVLDMIKLDKDGK